MKRIVNGVEVEMTQAEIDEINQFWNHPAPLELYQQALQALINKKASERQYNDAVSIASYVTSTNEQWALEAKTFVEWRDIAYTYAIDILDKVQAGTIAQPTIEDFISQLPRFNMA